ncbi:hypothetical protein MLD38_037677 [Melastoma candidum]|uniref:Uncharacterized protein n=1 Tax=Melastoma candidum TaxID=119954 RepID=A0ACB9LNE9_9MYRT|nr:hypothetical protein MLD38_037677 [Melastoma candidum]
MSLKKNMLRAAIVPLVVVFLAHPGNPLLFNISQFDPASTAVSYGGDAHPDDGAVDMTDQNQSGRVGHVTFNERVQLWDSSSGGLYDFTTHFAFTIDVGSRVYYGSGFAFFMAPEGFQIPLNSTGGFLGLYNTTFSNTSRKQIIHVEFDTYPSPKWDPEYEHVGINQNSIASSIMVPWDVKYHSGDTIDVTISYDASTMNLTVSWSFKTTPNPNETTSLSYPVDLRTVLPEWVTIGFSAATSYYTERHTLHCWDFSSKLVIKDPCSQKSNTSSQKSKWTKIATGVSASIVFLILLLIGAFELRSNRRRKTRMKEKAAEATNSTSINKDLERGAGPRSYTYKDLASATNNFSSELKLGEGGFGPVYKGYLLDLDIPVAVKKFSQGSKQGIREFFSEVKVISSLRHRNLVQLIGWCHDSNEFLLIYEFMPNGSLDSHLFGKRAPLLMPTRYKICLGLASALLYLHEEWEKCVIHRDIKSSNVMLDSNFNVKLGDFGLARLMDHELGPQTTGLAGTLGYLAPEYMAMGKASKESDVYGFGVVVLEIATGRRATDRTIKNTSSMMPGLVAWVWGLHGSGNILTAAEEKMTSDSDKTQVKRLLLVGLRCAHPDQSRRPSIRQAIRFLNFEADLPDLPNEMPVAVYHVPTPLVCSSGPSSISIITEGR